MADFTPGWRFYLAFISLSVITLAAALDATAVSIALPTITEKLQGTAIEASWCGISFFLSSTVVRPNFAAFSHIFGRKPMIMIAITFFAVEAIVAPLSNNFNIMLVGRSIQGVGAGGIIVLSEIIVTNLVPLRLRGKWLGFLASTWAVGSVSGPIIGGSFTQNGSGIMFPWVDWRTLLPLCLGFSSLIGFVFYEKYIADTRTSRLPYFHNFLQGLILFCVICYLPLYNEAVKGMSSILTGVAVLPETFTVAPAAVIVGFLIGVTGSYRWALWSGWILTTIGTALLYLLNVHTSTPAWIFLNLVFGIGTGTLCPSMNFAIQASVKQEDLAFAVAVFMFFGSFGQATGIAVGGAIFQNEFKKSLLASPLLAPFAEQYSREATSLVQIIHAMPNDLPQTAYLVQAFADSWKSIWMAMCAFAALGLIATLFVESYSLDVKHETEQGLQHDEKIVDMEG